MDSVQQSFLRITNTDDANDCDHLSAYACDRRNDVQCGGSAIFLWPVTLEARQATVDELRVVALS